MMRIGPVVLLLIAGCGHPAPPTTPPSVDGAARLSQMGLYRDLATRTLADGVVEYEPAFALWTDGAIKRRFIALPPGAQIDTSDMDHWVFPAGTKLFKEFTVDGTAVETRYLERTADGEYQLRTFAWLADGSDAVEVTDGVSNALGTGHDIPTVSMCPACHRGEPGRVLGFSAIQLSKPDGHGPTLTSLAQTGVLTNPPPTGVDYPPPGDPTTASALGYLHANCGHCHSPTGSAAFTGQFLRLDTADRSADATPTWRTTVNVSLSEFSAPGIAVRVAPGDPAHSAIVYRMSHRSDAAQMPPLATTRVDADGIRTVSAWIQSLTL